jgi:hypothetical protein
MRWISIPVYVMFIKIIVLVALIRLLIATDSPLLCSGLYTFVGFALGLLPVMGGQVSFLTLLLATVIRFGLSSLYFWLLYRIGGGILWWAVLILGLAIGLV